MHEIAKQHGLTPLYNSKGQLIEKPHIQLEGVSCNDFYKGKYPPDGDGSGPNGMCEMIDNWSGPIPLPAETAKRAAAPAHRPGPDRGTGTGGHRRTRQTCRPWPKPRRAMRRKTRGSRSCTPSSEEMGGWVRQPPA
jgi:hypothetical protein